MGQGGKMALCRSTNVWEGSGGMLPQLHKWASKAPLTSLADLCKAAKVDDSIMSDNDLQEILCIWNRKN